MSYGLCSLRYSKESLAIYATFQYHYETICELKACQKNQYTDGSGRRNLTTVTQLSFSARMEKTDREQVVFEKMKFLLSDHMEAGLNQAAEDSYWLGCIAPFLPFVGFADGMKIGGDVGSSWDGEFGPRNMMRCLTGNNYTNHRFYQTDPDAVMLRDFHIRLTEREIESLALLAAVSGSCIYTSDPLHRISEDRKKLFEFIEPDRRRKPSLPFLSEERPEIVMVHKEAEKGILFILNQSETDFRDAYDLERLGFPSDWYVFRFKTGEEEELWRKKLVVHIPPHGCRLYIASAHTPVAPDYERLWNNL